MKKAKIKEKMAKIRIRKIKIRINTKRNLVLEKKQCSLKPHKQSSLRATPVYRNIQSVSPYSPRWQMPANDYDRWVYLTCTLTLYGSHRPDPAR